MKSLLNAIDFAARKHSTQRRKDAAATPYINHPIEVATILSRNGVSEVRVLIAAILHDTIEDTATSAEEIAGAFGQYVYRLVQEVSDDKSLPKATRKRLQIEHAADCSSNARLIKMADKLSNFRSTIESPPVGWTKLQIDGYFAWGFAVVDACEPDAQWLELFEPFRQYVPENAAEVIEAYYASF